jgi:paraquat-inducible protein A
LILASIILFVPANLYPIMHYDELGTNYDSTILSGVIDLAANDLWLIAIVVFVASIVVPVLKLLMLGFLVWSVYVGMQGFTRLRSWMYRVTKFIGRWSMVDVYVVTLLTAVVQFGLIGQVEPGAALLPFASVVVLTMLAAETLDPRLIWENAAANAADARERTLAQLNAINLTRE